MPKGFPLLRFLLLRGVGDTNSLNKLEGKTKLDTLDCRIENSNVLSSFRMDMCLVPLRLCFVLQPVQLCFDIFVGLSIRAIVVDMENYLSFGYRSLEKSKLTDGEPTGVWGPLQVPHE